jgi:GDP-mannose pyrophosphatase NudK
LILFVGEYNPDQKASEGGGLKEEGEDIEVVEMPLQEALKKANSGEIKDAKTVLLIQWLHQNGNA